MSKLLKFKLNKKGVRELLRSQAMQDVLEDFADRKVQTAGDGYAADVHLGKNRAYANIYPDTKEAYFDNLDNNTLEKVIRS